MNRVYQTILQNLINSNFSLPNQSNEFYDYLIHIAEALPDFSEKIDLDSNLPSYQEGDTNPVPDWGRLDFFDNIDLWNESLRELWRAIKNYHERPQGANGEDERQLDIYIEPKEFESEPANTILIDDIKYGDAGASFQKLLSQLDSWVKPRENLFKEKYDSVRGVDYILIHMLNEALLQFTNRYSITEGDAAENRGIIHSQIRLLMPKNSRWVLVEDLNRNFWVLGNTIGGLCAYLFGGGSPLKDIYSKLINELVQLWENTIFLWILVALSTLKPYVDVHSEIFFVPNSDIEPYKKYDNFDTFSDLLASKNRIIKNTVAYAKKYQNSNCVMFPMIRVNNYEKNYFNTIIIPYVIFIIHEGDGTEKVITQELRDSMGNYIQIYSGDYTRHLWCAREVPVKYYYSYPLSDISLKVNEDEPHISHKYYGGLRPSLSIGSKEFNQGNINIRDVQISFTDAIGQSFNYNNLTSLTFKFDVLSSSFDNDYKNKATFQKNLSTQDDVEILETKPTTEGFENFSGYYLGDFPSIYNLNNEGKHFVVMSNSNLATQATLIKIGQYLPKLYNNGTNISVGNGQIILTQDIYNNRSYFSEQVTSSWQRTSYELNYTPNEKSWYQSQPMSISQCDFYVCDPTKTCFKRSVDLNENATQESAWSKLKDIGNEVITEFLSLRSIDKITYLIASIGASPWRNEKTLGGEIRQGYWSKNILTHAYRFIPHKLVDFWDKYGKSNNVETVTFYIDGQKCYLECLGFIGKIETAFGGGAVFRTVNNITWRLPEVRSYYDNYYNNFLELYDLNDADSIYYLNMSNYPDSDPLKQEYDAAVQSSDWTSFQQFLDDNYEDYKNDFLSEIDVGKSITSLAGLWNVYDGNTLIPVSETQPYPFNHLYHDSIVIKDGQEYKYRETGTTYFIFENGKIKLPTKEIPVNINGTDYWASSRVKDKLDPTKVDGTYIMEIDNNTIQERTISF